MQKNRQEVAKIVSFVENAGKKSNVKYVLFCFSIDFNALR